MDIDNLKNSFIMKKKFNEVWKKIEDYPDYEVSNLGRIRNKKTSLVLKSNVTKRKWKYLQPCVSLCYDGKGNTTVISRLVAKAFPEICGEWFDGCEVHHLDKNPENNRTDNLKVCTKEEHYKYHSGENHNCYGRPCSEETKKKISEKLKGENHPFYGKHPSEETRRRMSKSKMGRVLSEETRRRISKNRKGIVFTETHIENIRKSRDKMRKPVYQYTLDGEFVREWESMCEVKRELGYSDRHISECCKGKLKTAYGFLWKYKSDVENNK